jgi:hypothetical protein
VHRTQLLWTLIGASAGALLAMLAVYFFGDTKVNIASVSTGAFALGGLLLGAWLTRSTEHEKWLRDKRLEWFGALIETTYLLTLTRGLTAEVRFRARERAIAAKVTYFYLLAQADNRDQLSRSSQRRR